MKQITAASSALLLSALAATAHPSGHEGGVFETVKHLLSEPNHLLPIGFGIVIALVVLGKYVVFRKNHE